MIISAERQAKKSLMKKYNLTGKQIKRLMKRGRKIERDKENNN